MRIDCVFVWNARRINELVRIGVDALTSAARTLRVNCEDRPTSVVKAQLRKLDMFHIQYILRCLNETTGEIRNMHTYLLSTLYNAINTIDCYYKQLLAKNYRPPKKSYAEKDEGSDCGDCYFSREWEGGRGCG